ncbi:hypothetical protein Ocin01_09153 [Orchesella cincta]|uniref:Uncharacterized protein n=1 Tax=Orchesella cincta TaxID=48709 RepID=A0A1D2MXK1_ORCCI|nr:hypothetical protein Ocin01_09153 [Orchesella cincta]
MADGDGFRDTNNRCKRWVTVNQDEYRNPAETKVERYIQSEEMGRYEDCMECKKAPEEYTKAIARHEMCCAAQNEMREPTYIPDDHHINPAVKCKPSWCRCLATGDPNMYDEVRGEKATEDLCQCKKCYNQMENTNDNSKTRVYSSTYFLDYRNPGFPYIQTKLANQHEIDERFKAYKAKRDAEDELKEPKITPAAPEPEDRVDPNCLCLYEDLPDAKIQRSWKPDERWWRNPTDNCRKGMVKKYIWTSTYREMNKDGAALPLTKHDIPTSSKEANANPIQNAAELAEPTLVKIGEVFEKWDRPQVRVMAQRCDTMYNRPDLCHDAYFQEHRLCRTKFAREPATHVSATRENMELVKKEKLRLCYDRPIPGYAGYDCIVAPPVCKIKKNMNPWDPYEMMSSYQANYIFHPEESYTDPVQPIKPDDFDKMGIATNPINTLGRIPLPCAQRLSCYLECNLPECPRGDTEICRSSPS